jgi:hypothetical protein
MTFHIVIRGKPTDIEGGDHFNTDPSHRDKAQNVTEYSAMKESHG